MTLYDLNICDGQGNDLDDHLWFSSADKSSQPLSWPKGKWQKEIRAFANKYNGGIEFEKDWEPGTDILFRGTEPGHDEYPYDVSEFIISFVST